MASQRIVLAGATGNLGGRIAHELRQRGASVCALVRPGTSAERLAGLRGQQMEIVEAELHSRADVVRACEGASCVVSALLGLEKLESAPIRSTSVLNGAFMNL